MVLKEKRYPVVMLDTPNNENAFFVEFIDDVEKQNLLFFISVIDFYIEYVSALEEKDSEKVTTQAFMKKLENVLKRIIFFVIKTDESDPYTCEGIPDRNR